MGEIAEMMLDGTLDQYTGEYIGPAVGYPRSLSDRKRGKRYKQTKFSDYQKMRGVMFYLHDKGYTNAEAAHKFIRKYAEEELQIELPSKRWVMAACMEIQKDFIRFSIYVNSSRG